MGSHRFLSISYCLSPFLCPERGEISAPPLDVMKGPQGAECGQWGEKQGWPASAWAAQVLQVNVVN